MNVLFLTFLSLALRYGMRFISKVLKDSLHEKFPDATEDELLKVGVQTGRNPGFLVGLITNFTFTFSSWSCSRFLILFLILLPCSCCFLVFCCPS